MTTPMDAHVAANLEPDVISVLEEQIAEAGVEFIYYQCISINGRVLAKVVPAKHLRRNLEKGVQFHGSAVSDLTSDRNGNLMGGGAQAPEITVVPDPETFAVMPWDPTVARFLCRIYTRPDSEHPGQPHPMDSRGLLYRHHAQFEAKHGVELRSGCEPEMSWIGASVDVISRPGVSPAYHGGTLDKMRPVFQRIIRYAQALGFDMVEGDYEDNGQLELNWMFDRVELTADRLITYRQICHQVGKELDVTPSFMAKPFTSIMGNGCHHNVSLWKDGVNQCIVPGRQDLHVNDIAKHMLGGMLTHACGSMMIMGCTVNSYKRFADIGLFAPTSVDWGLDNKSCSIRVSASGRLEYKLPDASVNPYLSHVALLAAIDDGLERKIDPGLPQSKSSYDQPSDTAIFEPLPLTLGAAVAKYDENDVIKDAIGEELSALLMEYKADEWARYCGIVTDWERAMYLEFLP